MSDIILTNQIEEGQLEAATPSEQTTSNKNPVGKGKRSSA